MADNFYNSKECFEAVCIIMTFTLQRGGPELVQSRSALSFLYKPAKGIARGHNNVLNKKPSCCWDDCIMPRNQ